MSNWRDYVARGSALVLLVTLAAGAAPEARAQQALGPEETAALAPVYAMFDAMRAKDAEALEALFTPGAQLVSAGTSPDGKPQLRVTPISEFAASIGQATAYLDEQVWDAQVIVSDRLATVWVKYVLYIDEAFSHCGVDAFQLFDSADGWKIFQVADTRRREDCWEPPS